MAQARPNLQLKSSESLDMHLSLYAFTIFSYNDFLKFETPVPRNISSCTVQLNHRRLEEPTGTESPRSRYAYSLSLFQLQDENNLRMSGRPEIHACFS